MKHLAIVLVLAISGTAAADSYLDNKKTATHDCAKDPDALVAGNENTITFTGACNRIVAAGNHNTLTIASVKRLELQGNENSATADEVDTIHAPGNRNTVV